MASVFRKTYTKPLPDSAEAFTRKGERFARWKDGKGKKRTAPLISGRNGLDRIVVKAGTYTAKYRDSSGVVQEVATGCRDETAARSVLSDLQRRMELIKANVITAAEDAIAGHQNIQLHEHITAYIEHQKAKELNAVRITNTQSRLKRIAEECGFLWLSDLNTEALSRWLTARKIDGMGAGTRNGYREACVAFCNWCIQSKRLLSNPFCDVPKASTKVDCRRKRRAMTEQELTKLIQVASARPLAEHGRQALRKQNLESNDRPSWTKEPLSLDNITAATERARQKLENNPSLIRQLTSLGRERALVYKTMVLTGLRKGELASLTVGQVCLDGPMPYLELDAAHEKNREGSQIPLRRDLAIELEQWVTFKRNAHRDDATIAISCQQSQERIQADEPLFYVPTGLVRILDRDLKAAGIPKHDEQGRSVDVHALRHSFGTLLSSNGVAPRTAQAAMRHSTIDLTMNVYTDPKLLDVQGALESLPSLSIAEAHPEVQKATGTEDARSALAPTLAPKPDNSGKTGASPVKKAPMASSLVDSPSLAVSTGADKRKHSLSIKDCECQEVGMTGFEPATSASRTQRSSQAEPHPDFGFGKNRTSNHSNTQVRTVNAESTLVCPEIRKSGFQFIPTELGCQPEIRYDTRHYKEKFDSDWSVQMETLPCKGCGILMP